MTSDWQPLPFDQAFEVNPRVKLNRGSEYDFVDMKAISSSVPTVGRAELRQFKGGGSRFLSGDTLVARITPCLENGKIARYQSPSNAPAHGSTEFIVIRGRSGVSCSAFANLVSRSQAFRAFAISQMTGSSGRQRVPTETLGNYQVLLPPLPEQRRIAAVLGALDDKIELNRKMNQTLEEMAQAIFKSWFIDFDGHDPADLVDSELGPIPQGWGASSIGAEFNLTMGLSPPGESYNEYGVGLPFYQGCRDFGFRYPIRRVYTTDERRIANEGDSLVSVRAPVGRTNVALERCCIGRGVAALRHKSGCASFTYWTARKLDSDFVKFNSEGTVFGAINKRDFLKLGVVRPSEGALARFAAICGPLDQRVCVAEEQSSTIAELRDTLLPKLISGEIRVPEAEEQVEAAL